MPAGEVIFEPRRGDVGRRFDLIPPLRGWKCIFLSAFAHDWLAVGHTISPLRGFGTGPRPLGERLWANGLAQRDPNQCPSPERAEQSSSIPHVSLVVGGSGRV